MSDARSGRRPGKRGATIDLPMWWYEEMLITLKGKSDQTVTDAINLLTTGDNWDRSTVTNFRRNKHTTIELALAISRAYHIPPPVFFATTKEEAAAIREIQIEHAGRRERLLREQREAALAAATKAQIAQGIVDDVGVEDMQKATARALAERRQNVRDSLVRRKRDAAHEHHTAEDLIPIDPKKK